MISRADSQTPPAYLSGSTRYQIIKSQTLQRLENRGKTFKKKKHMSCVCGRWTPGHQFQPFFQSFCSPLKEIHVKIRMACEDHKYVQISGLLFWVFFAYLCHFLTFAGICCVGESGMGNGSILQGKKLTLTNIYLAAMG